MTLFLGIDPGVRGAYVILNHGLSLIDCRPLPVMGPPRQRRLNSKALWLALAELDWQDERFAVVEDLIAMPGRRSTDAQSSGILYGAVLGVLQVRDFCIRTVRSQSWQKTIDGLPCRPSVKELEPKAKAAVLAKHRKNLKDTLKLKARMQCPELSQEMEKFGAAGDGLADAYWIARWGAVQGTFTVTV